MFTQSALARVPRRAASSYPRRQRPSQPCRSICTSDDTMKLLTHNMLACHIKGIKNNYPFVIEAVQIEQRDADFNPEFLKHIFPRINWPAFLQGAQALKCQEGLPEQATEAMLEDDSFMQKFHHALLEVTLAEGALVCPETGRKFPVSKGIPNLLLSEDEC